MPQGVHIVRILCAYKWVGHMKRDGVLGADVAFTTITLPGPAIYSPSGEAEKGIDL